MVSATDAAGQYEERDVDAIGQPKIRTGALNCTNAIKSTCTEVSVKCNISPQCSQIAVKAVCKGLYNSTYYLDRDDAIDIDLNLARFRCISLGPRKLKLMTNG